MGKNTHKKGTSNAKPSLLQPILIMTDFKVLSATLTTSLTLCPINISGVGLLTIGKALL